MACKEYLESLEINVGGLLVLSHGLHHERHIAQSAGVDAVSPPEVIVHLIHQSVGHLQSVLLREQGRSVDIRLERLASASNRVKADSPTEDMIA